MGEVYHHPKVMVLMSAPSRTRLVAFAQSRPSFTRREANAHGIHDRWLRRLLDEGAIERIGHGLYRAARPPRTSYESLLDACDAVPNGVICLASALAYHRLSTINPSKIDMAVRRDEWRRVVSYPPVVFHKFRDMTTGLERHRLEDRELRIFNAERAVCDTFRFRRELGRDIALESLQTYMRGAKRNKVSALTAMAHKMGVAQVMRPYLEALV